MIRTRAGCLSAGFLCFVLVFTLGVPRPAVAQFDNPIPDTLDWRRYFPLEVGNEWHYNINDPPGEDKLARWRITKDSTLDGFTFFALETTIFDQAGRQTYSDTILVRYDTACANVIERAHYADGTPVDLWFMEVPCGLDGSFNILRYECHGIRSGMDYQIIGMYDARYIIHRNLSRNIFTSNQTPAIDSFSTALRILM